MSQEDDYLRYEAKKSGLFTEDEVLKIDFKQCQNRFWFHNNKTKYISKVLLLSHWDKELIEEGSESGLSNINETKPSAILKELRTLKIALGEPTLAGWKSNLIKAGISYSECETYIAVEYYENIKKIQTVTLSELYYFSEKSIFVCGVMEELSDYAITEGCIRLLKIEKLKTVSKKIRPIGVINKKKDSFPITYIFKKVLPADIHIVKSINNLIRSDVIYLNPVDAWINELGVIKIATTGFNYTNMEGYRIAGEVSVLNDKIKNGWIEIETETETIVYGCGSVGCKGVSSNNTVYSGLFDKTIDDINIYSTDIKINLLGLGLHTKDGSFCTRIPRKRWQEPTIQTRQQTLLKIWIIKNSISVFNYDTKMGGIIAINKNFIYVNLDSYVRMYAARDADAMGQMLSNYFGKLVFIKESMGIIKYKIV